ncbi:4-(cytidine 5'-diphospho)-2-C-methyl-D-erythritol kinase, partial [Pseudomonas sp. SIMBA_044]
FTLGGRFAADIGGEPDNNLVLRARDLLRQAAFAQGGHAPAVSIHLEKNLPIASGIGGGSADAAAALRGLQRFWNVRVSAD